MTDSLSSGRTPAAVTNAADEVALLLSKKGRDSSVWRSARTIGVVLGSGLGSLADKIDSPTAIPFESVPGFGKSTASGHRGQLIFGHLEETPVIAMAGRLHRYEGWTDAEVAFPIHVMASLGARALITSNAAGGVNPKLCVGDIVVIRDHIHWLHASAGQVGKPNPEIKETLHALQPTESNDQVSPAGANRGRVYSDSLAQLAFAASRGQGFTAVPGTYLATLGPTYETRAEYRMMRRMGVDVVGMSTVPEVLAAAGHGIPVLALSIVTNVADPDRAVVADHSEVLQAGDAAAVKLEGIVRRICQHARLSGRI